MSFRAAVLCGTSIAVASAVAAAPASEGRRIALAYDPRLIEADFPTPALRMRVGGRTAWFLVDTGAGVHLIASWFVKAAELTTDEGLGREVTGVDATGRPMAFRGLRDVTGVLDDGSPLRLPIAAVTDFAPEFEEADVAGALSPQLLAAAGEAAALDLRVPELRLESFAAAVSRLGARRVPRERAEICGSPTGKIPNLLFAIPITARGRKGSLLMDSGARVTKLVPGSSLVRGLRLEVGGRTTGLTGTAQTFSLIRGLRVEFAGYARELDARVAGRGHGVCGRDGLLGLDALASCAVVLGEHDVAVACSR